MKFCILALDYDGTIAVKGKAHPDVLAALREPRAQGIVLVLVTGRILSELQRAVGDLEIFNAIVAENGAVLAFPNRRTRLLGWVANVLPPEMPELHGNIESLKQRMPAPLLGVMPAGADAPLDLSLLLSRSRELPETPDAEAP